MSSVYSRVVFHTVVSGPTGLRVIGSVAYGKRRVAPVAEDLREDRRPEDDREDEHDGGDRAREEHPVGRGRCATPSQAARPARR